MKIRCALLFVFQAVIMSTIARADPVKVACVGDSITYGSGIPDRDHFSYPAVLGVLLGPSYEVRNFGVGGATALKAGDKPYWNQPEMKEADAFAPNVVVLKLGTNDSKPQNWNAKNFRTDYEAMITHFAALPSTPRVFLCLPVPAYRKNYGIRENIIQDERVIIRQIAASQKHPLIDLETPLSGHPEWFPDGIHPNADGASQIAKAVAVALRQ